MSKLIIRIIASILIAVLLANVEVEGNEEVLKTLFTVIGIVFSISMSLLVSFNLSKILNESIRRNIRQMINNVKNMLLIDFCITTAALSIALILDKSYLTMSIHSVTIDIMLIAVVWTTFSLIYEIYNFKNLHKLHTDIEDALINEETQNRNNL